MPCWLVLYPAHSSKWLLPFRSVANSVHIPGAMASDHATPHSVKTCIQQCCLVPYCAVLCTLVHIYIYIYIYTRMLRVKLETSINCWGVEVRIYTPGYHCAVPGKFWLDSQDSGNDMLPNKTNHLAKQWQPFWGSGLSMRLPLDCQTTTLLMCNHPYTPGEYTKLL